MSCDTLRQTLKHELAQQFFTFFNEGSDKHMFLAIAKTTPWTTEPTPETEIDCVRDDTSFWREMIAAKKITPSDISFVVPRYDWSTGIVWDSYRDTEDMWNDDTPKKFYVLVDNERIYKCIDNNDSAVSIEKPIETNTGVFQTSDGYRWKYLCKITSTQSKFLTKEFMPVKYVSGIINSSDPFQSQLDVQNAAIDGSIQFIEITQTGDRFLNAIPDNANNDFTAYVSNTQYRITSNLISSNDGAYIGYSIKVTDANSPNFGEIRQITAYDGDTQQITINAAFSNPTDLGNNARQFSIIPTVKIHGDGSNAIAEAKINSSTKYLSTIEMANVGLNYTFADIDIVPAPNSGTQYVGSTGGIPATATAVLAPVGGHGFNVLKELGSRHVAISVKLNKEENGVISGIHDFRQFGLLLNPLAYNSFRVAGTEDTYIHSYQVSSPNIINQFSGLTIGDRRIIGNSSGFNGLFYKYTTALGNPEGGTLEIQNPNGTLVNKDKIIISNPNFTNASLKEINVIQLTGNRLLNPKDVYRQTYKFTVIDATNNLTSDTFGEDGQVVGTVSGATGSVAAWYRGFTNGAYETDEGYLEVVDTLGSFVVNDNLKTVGSTGALSETKGTINSILTPELTYRSGDLIYIENIQILQRDEEQQEEFLIIVGV